MKKLLSMFMTLLMAGSLIAAEVLNTNFTQGQGSWTIDNVSMEGVTYVWQQTSQYGMKASAYYQNANHVSESWLISPTIDLSDADTVSLYIEHAMNKGTAQTLAVKAKAANDADWTTLNVVWPQGINWTFITSTSDISSAFAHKQGVQIAFVYISDASNAPTWEIKNVVVSASAASSVTPDPDPETEPIAMESCAAAAEAAMSVSGTNVLYNNGAKYTLVGYVTGIATDYNATANNMTFWMADEADGGHVLQAFRVVPESANNLPEVGDKVQVTGQLTKYNQIPEFAAGCTCIIIEKSAPAVNLGEMTIAEFLELKNPKDTCILTGTVSNIVDTLNGYFDLVEPGNENISVYVYGLQTADGRAQQFNTLGIAAGDTLTLKGIYYDYNGKDEVKYGIFVELKKVYIEPETQTIEINTPSSINYRDAVATNGWWIMAGEDDTFSIMLSNLSTEITQAVGSYTAEELDPEYSFIIMSASPQDTILFTDGEIILSYDTVGTQAFVYINGTLVGTDGNSYLINLIYEKTLPISYYLVGSFNGWAPADAYELKANFNAEGEYKMNVTLAVGDELKVVSKQGDVLTWYPDNAGNYAVDAAHAGDKTLYFRPEGNSEWASFHTGGFFYIDETPIPEVVNITLTTGLIYQDNVESYGWWQMYGNFDEYTISLSNGNSISEAPGTYTADDLDADYSYIQMTGSDTKITFTAGTVTLSVDETTYAVTVAGQLTGIDEKIYNLQLTYCEPKAENTVQLSIVEGTMKDYVETLNGYSNYGTAEDGTYVQLLLLTDNPVGTFTADNLATNYSFLQINGIYINIYSADITVVKRADGSYLTIADLLCYNNTLYQVTITAPAPVATGLDATTSTRAKKYIHNGMLIIEKNGHRYNAFGQVTD